MNTLSTSLILHLLLACSDTTTSTNQEESASTEDKPATEVTEDDDITLVDKPFYLYHNARKNILNLDWYDVGFFGHRQQDFQGKWSISPKTEGALVVDDANKLDFVPTKPLPPNQTYTIQIEEVQDHNSDRVWKPTNPKLWTQTITTPPFKVLGMSFGKLDRASSTAVLLLDLSHPVPLEEVKAKTTILLNGKSPRTVTFAERNGRIEATVSADTLLDQTLEVTIAPLKYSDTITAEEFIWKGDLGNWTKVHLYGPYVKESATGFSIEYICDDTSVSDKSWYWDSEISFDQRISTRCAIDTDQIANSLTIDPPVRDLKIYPRKHGFAIIGDFSQGNHTLTIPAGITTQDGGAVLETIVDPILIPHRSSTLRFHSTGRYMPIAGWTELHFQHRNVNTVTMEVRTVSKANLHHWIQDGDERVDASEGKKLLHKEITLKNNADEMMRSSLNLKEHLPSREAGIYEVSLKDEDGDSRATLMVQVTDMNLITKRYPLEDGSQMVSAWVINSRTNEPISNVNMSIVSTTGDTTTDCTSDAQGYCSFTIPADELNNNVFALYAEQTGADGNPELAYLVFDSLSIDLGLYDASGTTGSDKEYRIAAHTDRGAYRPGDTVQLFGLVRETDNTAPTEGLPIHLSIKDGRGQIVQEHTLNTNAAGVFTHTLNVSDHANTGTWVAEWSIHGGNKKETIGEQQTSFKVENLMPERLAVQAKFTDKNVLGGTALKGTIEARYLFGKSAEGSEFQVRCDVESTPFSPKANRNYTYGSPTAFENFYLGTVTGTLDEAGTGTFECPNPERLSGLPGMATVVASIDVLESGSGRSTKRSSRMKVHPTETYLGLQIGIDPEEFKPNVEYPVSGIVVDWDGHRQNSLAAVDIQFSEVDYSSNWSFNEESHRYEVSYKRFEKPLHTQTVPVNKGLFQFSIQGDRRVKEYRIRAQSESNITFLDLERAYGYWYSRTRVQTPDPFRPDSLDIHVPESMNLKETVTATTVVPYPGKLLWTIENDGIIRQEWMNIEEAGEVQWQFSLAGQAFQNTVYATALLVKDAHSDSELAYMPSRAFGTQPIKVRSKNFNHTLSIDAPTEVQANSTMTVNLDLGGTVEDDTVAMVAVVDEGLLSLTNFATPDPSDALFPKMPLKVDTAETVGWGISSPSMDSAPAGGGAGEGNARRKAKVVKPVALWSGLVDVNSDGTASAEFDIPQYSGSVRVMAWSASPTRFASADDNVLVRDPLTMQATLPRFLTEGDVFDVPVFVTNLSGKEQTVTVSLDAESSIPLGRTEAIQTKTIQFLNKDKRTVTIAADEQTVLVFKAKALAESGFATFNVVAENADGSLQSKEQLDVPFGSRKPTERSFTSINLKDVLGGNLNGTADISAYVQGWTVEDTNIWATNNPYSESLIRVRDLIRYPYGCVEQTSSSLRPLLSAVDILEMVDPATLSQQPVEKMVLAGIERLASMQTSDGGIGYWPGDQQSHPWGTAYATHVLLDAKAAGHPVMDSLLNESLDYLERVSNGSMNYSYYSDYMSTAKPYAHYLLARSERGKPVAIRTLLEESDIDSYESEYMLKTALYLSGDRTYEEELKQLTNLHTISTKYNPLSFRTRLRSKALILSLHQELFGSKTTAGDTLAMSIHQEILTYKKRYPSTQVLGWSTFALAQRVLLDRDWKAPTLFKNKQTLTANGNKIGNRSWTVWDTERKGDTLTLQGSGSDGFLLLSTQGVRSDGNHQYGDNGLKVSRTYQNMDGTTFNPETQELGAEVVVVLTVSNQSSENLHELALVDRIPAGWEIQNPNLQTNDINPEQFTAVSAWSTDYLSVQDSELRVFGDLKKGDTKSIVYVARATTSGTFTIPPVSIEAMYDDTIWSRHKGMVVQISGDWNGDQL